MKQRRGRATLVTIAAVILLGTLVLTVHRASVAQADASSAAVSQVSGQAFVFGLDPQDETFGFTYTLPIDTNPQDVLALVDGDETEVWIAETGTDRIGRLTYADPSDYVYQGYQLPAGSKPLSLLAHDGYIWFTAAGADAVGRLDPGRGPETGELVLFDVGAGTYPADLVAGPGGDIWFTQMMAHQLGQLVIETPTNYAVHTYRHTRLDGGRPRGIAVSGSSIYVAQTANDLVSIFTPPSSWIHMPTSVSPVELNEPYAMTTDSEGTVWGTERAGNSVNQYGVLSFPDIARYATWISPPNSRPTGIAVDPSDDVWFTQHAAGRVARLSPDAPTGALRSYFLPQEGLAPTGIAADENGLIWVVASRPYRVYVPLMIQEGS